jgi:hypothetical protein
MGPVISCSSAPNFLFPGQRGAGDGPLARAHIDVGTRIIVPNAKIKWDQGNPTGHGVIFLRSDDKWVYCYAPPGGV